MVPPPVQLDEDEIDEAVALIEAMTRDDLTGPEFTDGYTDAPFAHAPSGSFQANAAWLALAALAFNLTRAAGTLAGTFHAKVTCATIRDRLINIPVRLARSARRLTLHLPEHWPWQDAFDNPFTTVHAPPQAA